MKKLFGSKVFIVLLAFGGLIALILLSAALRDFTFRPPEPFSFNFGQAGPLSLPAQPENELPLWKLLLFGALLFFIFLVLLLLLDPETRKLLLKKLFRFALSVVAIWIALQYAYEHGSLEKTVDLLMGNGKNAPTAPQAPPIPEYVPPQINPWLVFAVSFGIALALVLIGWFIYSRRQKPGQPLSLDEIAGIAREARDGLQDGGNWDNAIVRCYVRMNEVVTQERGLVRQLGTTPAEFALRLERAGLPGEAVRTLTGLFEGVRYGGKTTGPADRDMASAALSAILHYCGVNV
jgi:hypothetical protein